MTHVCIITPSGMVCSASPLRAHFHGRARGDVAHKWSTRQKAKAKKLRALMAKVPGEFSVHEKQLMGQVVDLMLAVNVKKGRHFTIVHSR
jgi:hypothetical protein